MRDGMVERALPFPALSLTRCVLDEALLQCAAAAGADVRRNCNVEALERCGDAWSAVLRGGDVASSRNVFLATGKHDVRGWPRPAGTHRGLVAFKMYYRLSPAQHAALGDAIELVLFPGGYAGLQPVEGGRVNLCLLMTASRLKDVGSSWAQIEAHLLRHVRHLRDRLEGATQLLDVPLAASHIPYGHMQASAPEGLWRVGDQAAVIPSFCGDGMAIALHSGALAVRHYLRGDSAETYRRQLHAQLRLRLAFATRLSQTMVTFPGAANAVRLVPELLSGIARMTRIPDAALLRDGT
jgi:menaquinone-9 beta-reductase